MKTIELTVLFVPLGDHRFHHKAETHDLVIKQVSEKECMIEKDRYALFDKYQRIPNTPRLSELLNG